MVVYPYAQIVFVSYVSNCGNQIFLDLAG